MGKKYKQYLICKERGHERSAFAAIRGYHVIDKCKFCGTRYFWHRTETLVEENTPKENE